MGGTMPDGTVIAHEYGILAVVGHRVYFYSSKITADEAAGTVIIEKG